MSKGSTLIFASVLVLILSPFIILTSVLVAHHAQYTRFLQSCEMDLPHYRCELLWRHAND